MGGASNVEILSAVAVLRLIGRAQCFIEFYFDPPITARLRHGRKSKLRIARSGQADRVPAMPSATNPSSAIAKFNAAEWAYPRASPAAGRYHPD
jgi:hypothetical protein